MGSQIHFASDWADFDILKEMPVELVHAMPHSFHKFFFFLGTTYLSCHFFNQIRIISSN